MTNTRPSKATVIALIPTLSGSDPRSKIFVTTTTPAIKAAPTTRGQVGIFLTRCTPPTLAIDANGPSRTNLRAGPPIAMIPHSVPATAPTAMRLGVKCAPMAPPEPANIDCPKLLSR